MPLYVHRFVDTARFRQEHSLTVVARQTRKLPCRRGSSDKHTPLRAWVVKQEHSLTVVARQTRTLLYGPGSPDKNTPLSAWVVRQEHSLTDVGRQTSTLPYGRASPGTAHDWRFAGGLLKPRTQSECRPRRRRWLDGICDFAERRATSAWTVRRGPTPHRQGPRSRNSVPGSPCSGSGCVVCRRAPEIGRASCRERV